MGSGAMGSGLVYCLRFDLSISGKVPCCPRFAATLSPLSSELMGPTDR